MRPLWVPNLNTSRAVVHYDVNHIGVIITSEVAVVIVVVVVVVVVVVAVVAVEAVVAVVVVVVAVVVPVVPVVVVVSSNNLIIVNLRLPSYYYSWRCKAGGTTLPSCSGRESLKHRQPP